jgi:acyl-CoA synthetase (AMP-forming)/AMP-acid ligase II
MHADPVVVVLDTVQQVVRELHPQDEHTVSPTLDNTLERDPGLDSRERGPVLDSIQRECFMRTGQAVPTTPDDLHALRFVACGQPLPGHQIRIVDAAGFEVAERQEGRVEFCGPSATSGYFHNPEEIRRLFHGTWLDAGNLAYMASGEVYVTGRTKDLIIRAGRNIYPQELEEVIEDIPRIRKGCVAVFGSPDSVARTERLVILAETYETDRQSLEEAPGNGLDGSGHVARCGACGDRASLRRT